MKMKYVGHLPEVQLLMTGKTFKKDVPVVVTEREVDALKGRKEFKFVKKETKKEGDK